VVNRCRLLAAVAAALQLLSCSGPPESDSTLQLALETSPNNLDPALVVDVAEGEICALVFQGLVRFARDGRVLPDLARSWEIGAGNTRYTFFLDGRMRFSSGRRVIASDVVFSFERVLGPESRSSRRWVLDRIRGAAAFSRGETGAIAGLSAPDDSTVVIELAEPFGPFLSMLSLPAAKVVPAEAVSGPARSGANGGGFGTFAGLPVGSGRWRVVRWQRGDFLKLEKNPFYPDTTGGLSAIRFRIIPEAFTRVAEFESGTLDILKIPAAELDRFRNSGRYNPVLHELAELRVYYIGLNNRRFDDVRVRRALNQAIDVDRLIDVLASGAARRATGSVPPGLPGYRPGTPFPYDREGAKALLAQAGYPDGFEMEIWQRESTEGNRILEAVQGYLAEAGVEVRLVRREWSAFKEAVSAGRVDAFFLDWFADYPDAENFLYPLFHSDNAGGGGNRVFFSDARVDSLIEAAGRVVDVERSASMYAEVDSLIHARAPWIYLYHPVTYYVTGDGISGFEPPVVYLGADYSGVRKQ
jgi:peptide/nickel transport system substrate-binding protein/oligopeptide transport system substrate-binding protein